MREALARRLLRAAVGDHRLAADHSLPGDRQRHPAGREIDIGPAAETYDPETLPGNDLLALAQIADDAPCNEPGDLDDGDVAATVELVHRRNADRHPLIVLACFVEAGIDELALAIAQLRNAPTDRDAVDVAIEDVEEDADPSHRCRAHFELGRGDRRSDGEHAPIGRTGHPPGAQRRPPPGVAKEI